MNTDELIKTDKLITSLLNGDVPALSKLITLIESNSPDHFEIAQYVITKILPHAGNSFRIGITGVPGAGKSTFIETFGLKLIEKGHKVAVLAIDPSSSITQGSILGDKTRMEKLSREKNCFIRPSPSGGSLGGVANKTRESILLCEASGYDRIIVESMGVGQSEIDLRSMVDFMLLLLIPGGGDELQGIKKGIIEIADLIAVNKSDGDNIGSAKISAAEYSSALRYLNHYTKGWEAKALTCSSLTGEGIQEIISITEEFENYTKPNGIFDANRRIQRKEWLKKLLREGLFRMFYSDETLALRYANLQTKVLEGELSPAVAAEQLLKEFKKSGSSV